MREDFLIDRQHFYLSNPVTQQVHPPSVTSAHAAYLNALHDVHQLYGTFSDDDANDYYPEVDEPEGFVLPSPEVMIAAVFTPSASDSSLDISTPLKCTQPSSEICSTSVVDEPMVVVAAHVADVTSSERVFQPNPDPQEVDVVVISSSDDEA
ncbi:hypothetical protein MKW92_052567 [Papaver armeniacum]|nr:hypothetical protein MKW92_052567 [Papaver armeniacum]